MARHPVNAPDSTQSESSPSRYPVPWTFRPIRLLRRRIRASGTKTKQNATAHLILANALRADELLVWMVSPTEVLPAPAETGLGENVAVAPLGSPLAEKLTATGMVGTPFGVSVSV